MTIYAYFRKLMKTKTTKGTEVYTCWQGIPHTNNFFGKKPVASTVVALRFKQFVGWSSVLANMAKFKNIGEVDCHHAKNNFLTKY